MKGFLLFLFLAGITFSVLNIIRGRLWDGQERVSFVLISEEVSLASFSLQSEELVFLSLPSQTQIEVTHGYGEYSLRSLWGLEVQEKRKGLLAESLQENLGIPVEGWMVSISNFKFQISNLKEEILSELGRQILGKGETNFTKWDLVRLWWQIRKLRSTNIKILDLSNISVLIEGRLADGRPVWEIDKTALDRQLGKFFEDKRLRQENLGIEVLNGTSHPGLAERAARLLSNIGGEVIWVGNSDLKYQISNIKSQKEKRNSYTVKRIAEIFNTSWEEKEEEGKAEITLILGEDYWQKLNQK